MAINPDLQEYIETEIFPKYEKYYAHGMLHINNVVENTLMLAEYYHLNENIAYVIATYHDIGLNINRDNHEHESGKFLESDPTLKKFFNSEQIQIMKAAVEDHRGSRKTPPRNIYGKILSDSDRDFDPEINAKRQLATSIKNYPELTTFEEHFERCYRYMSQRINTSGKFNLWTDNPTMIARRNKFTTDFLDKATMRKLYEKEWHRFESDGTMDKIFNYYEDY